MTSEDLEWLLAISPGGSSPVPGLSEQGLCSVISFLFNADDNDQFEALYSVCKKWPLLHSYFAFLIDGVPIESADAAQARERQKQMREMRGRTRPPAVTDIPAETAGLLARAKKGEWHAWCWLNLILMLTPTSPAIVEGLNYHITTMPGWASADDATRRRIVATAQPYLTDAESSVDLWFGKDPMPIHSNDLSAVRALVLLRQECPDVYAAISTVVWEKWARVIVGLRLSLSNESSGDLRHIRQDALANAPVAFVSAVGQMLCIEKALARSSPQAASVAHPFLFLQDLDDCWDDVDLRPLS